MATIREYFDHDPRALTLHTEWSHTSGDQANVTTIIAKIAYDFEANAKYWYFYVPANQHLSDCLTAIIRSEDFRACRLGPEGDGVAVAMGHSDYSQRLSNESLQFTNRFHIYLDFDLTAADREHLVSEARGLGFFLSIRDREYARKRSESEKPLAFISHDSRDKAEFVRALADELFKQFCPVWYDEYSLKVGDSLRSSIERGLKEAKKCVVVLSPNFLENRGWGLAEFDSIFTREVLEKTNIILPVWMNVDAKAVFDYSPRLADRVGLSTSLGVEEVARRLSNAIKSDTEPASRD